MTGGILHQNKSNNIKATTNGRAEQKSTTQQPRKNEPIVGTKQQSCNRKQEEEETEEEEREKREIKKGKEGKKTQQWLSMFIYSKTWVEEGGTDGGKRLEKTPFY